jgi:glycosyltransferase involved in cell wall biosynthesis
MPIFERISEAPVQTLGEVDALAAGPMEVRMRSALERSSVSVAESLDPVRVLHVIPSLKQGGAESMLSGLIRSASPSFGHHVHSLLPANDFFGLDTAVLTSGTGRRGIPSLRMWRELSATLERFRPHLVHAWMYHANLATAVAATGGGHRVIWSIHNGEIAAGHFKRSTRLVDGLCARLSWRVPDRIVYVSSSVREIHEASGYDPSRGVVIANGIDLRRFQLSKRAKRARDAPVVIALVGRYDPLKGHHFLLEVVASHPARDRIQLVFAGRGCDSSAALQRHVARAGLARQCRIYGAVRAIERIYAESDIVILPSFSEAFPVTLIEAAATGALIVASDVGEAGKLGFDQRLLFGPGDAAGCAAALLAAISDLATWEGRSLRNRRIAERFTVEGMTMQYQDLYRSIAGEPGRD